MFDQAGMSLGKVTMDGSEQIGPFDLAVIAFNVRFRQDLTSCWENLRSATIQTLIDAAPECKQGVLRKCFSDAAEQIAAVVHSHFPRLLAVATKQRPSGHGQQKSPMGWTAAHIGGQAYNFLGMEAENFKDTATPRADSRVLEATCQILYCARCLPKDSTDEFLLPWWADHNYLVGYWLGRNSVVEDGLDSLVGDYPFLPPSGDESEGISHADSLAWIRECEVEIRNALECQIEKEMFDAVIVAGATGDAVAKKPNGEPKLTAANRKGRSKDKLVAYHAKQVSLIIQEGCVGEEYCRRLTQRGILPPPRWRAEGCPKDYIDAYNHPKPEERKKWRARIYSEKNKIAKNPLAKTRN